jgi:hypothetical protein
MELDCREGAIVVWEEGLTAFALTLGEASVEHDTSGARADAIRWDFSALVCASSS